MKILLNICLSCLLLTVVGCPLNREGPTSTKDTVQIAQDFRTYKELQPLTYEQRQGSHVYAKYCAVCHGTEGKGDGFNAFNLDPKPRDFTDARLMNALSDERLLETIIEGGRGVNKSVLMPSWGKRLNSDERVYVAAYVRLLSKPNDGEQPGQ